MANVINKTDGRILRSVNTPDYPTEDWIINPDNLEDMHQVPRHYRVSSGNTVREATVGEKQNIDNIRLPKIKVKWFRLARENLNNALSYVKFADLDTEVPVIIARYKTIIRDIYLSTNITEINSVDLEVL